MLEVIHLYKTYKSKKSTDTEALSDISLKLGDSGLVFVLGKSGSGKSTFLNVLGGLDSFDKGEIIINGRSSNEFKASDFDSYRNTFLGFVFQDFNILEGFSVGKNISLALQLQDLKVDKDAVSNILKQVDLEGFENRKPNELSGGQKQRVAIARALIKNPSVIFADEPTGALDSATGRQVFDTLKKLSKDKLIVVVSHDRDFAEEYGDRIIELKDGKVISDITRNERKAKAHQEIEILDKMIIKLPKGFHLTEEHIDKINKIIDRAKSDTYLTVNDFKDLQKAFPEKVKKYEKDETIVDYIATNQDEIVETA
ncbi:MAG: ABC transporter ATP-binding protein, partial [Clostridia bacterium]